MWAHELTGKHVHDAGTSSIRTSVASLTTATVSPNPNNRMNDTCAAINAAKEIAMINAAAVITRPARATPSATLSSLAAGCDPMPASTPDPRQQEYLVIHG